MNPQRRLYILNNKNER